MTNEEIVQEAREVREMNEYAAMTPEQKSFEDSVTRFTLRLAKMGDDDLYSTIVREELRAAIEEEREACAKLVESEACKDQVGEFILPVIAKLIRARSNS